MTWLSDEAVDRLREAAAWPALDPRYEVTGVAGRGGMGTVFVAHDRVLDRDVAVKVVDVSGAAGVRAARLAREARILARLDHPGLVPIHDSGTLPDGRAYYVMKLVRGRPLGEALTGHDGLARRLDLFARLLDTVAFAHGRGVVHRDLKPDNVMVGEYGEVYVMDWGLAIDPAQHDADLAAAGTPGFMAPEQARGEAVDPRADVYALGALLRHLLPDPAPAALAAIARKATEADPSKRYPDVEALAGDVSRFRNHQPVQAHRETVGERLLRVYRRYELAVLLVVAYLLMRAALIIWKGF